MFGIQRKSQMETQTNLPMRKFTVHIVVIPTVLEQKLFGTAIRHENRVIEGYTLKDAKKRAGIQ
jgi:hypothetical protein